MLPTVTNCACDGSGWRVVDRQDVLGKQAVACACQIERRIRKELPPRFHSARVNDFRPELQLAVGQWLTNPRDGLFVTGHAGTGKTHLGAAILRARIEQGLGTTFRRGADFYAALRETYGGNTAERSVLDPLCVTRLLIFDDLGSGSLSDHERRATLEVLDRRSNAMLPTCVTSNWTIGEIADRMDDRIASRLAAFVCLELGGEDRRLAGQSPPPVEASATAIHAGRG